MNTSIEKLFFADTTPSIMKLQMLKTVADMQVSYTCGSFTKLQS